MLKSLFANKKSSIYQLTTRVVDSGRDNVGYLILTDDDCYQYCGESISNFNGMKWREPVYCVYGYENYQTKQSISLSVGLDPILKFDEIRPSFNVDANFNIMSIEDLKELPNIGLKLAKNILNYRTHKRFTSVEQ